MIKPQPWVEAGKTMISEVHITCAAAKAAAESSGYYGPCWSPCRTDGALHEPIVWWRFLLQGAELIFLGFEVFIAHAELWLRAVGLSFMSTTMSKTIG